MRPKRTQNNGTFTTVLHAILATLAIILGAIWLVVGIGFGFGGATDAFDYVASHILVATGVVLVWNGALVLRMPSRREERAQGITHGNEAQLDHTRAKEPVAAQETELMLLRTDDVFSTIKDMVRTFERGSSQTRELTHLVSMLQEANINDWDNAPVCGVSKLVRTGQYWLCANAAHLHAQDYDRYVAAEAALNIDAALPRLAHNGFDDPSTLDAVATCLCAIVDAPPARYDFDASLGVAYKGTRPLDTPGEWYCRVALVNDIECARLPFRLAYDVRANAAEGLAVLRVEIPRPACFCVVTADPAHRMACARAYALRLSWLLASHAFELVPSLRHVEILCCEYGEREVRLAVDYTKRLVELLAPVVRGANMDGRDFPQDVAIRADFDADGWFLPVEPWVSLHDERVNSAVWTSCPELDDRALSMRCAEVTGARRVCDLAINENGPRVDAADRLFQRWQALADRSCEAVVASIVEVRGSTNNLPLAEECDRVIAALLEGTVDPADDEALRGLIVRDGALQDAVERAYELMERDVPDPEEALRVLRKALDPIMAVGFYADDESCTYRYFGSTAERLAYNTRVREGAREVRLVPDSYYNALCLLASALGVLERYDEAERIADEMMRVAPVSMDAVIRKARILENESRLFEAVELIKGALPLVMTPRDAALAHYRLAYLEWRLGKEELAVACYQRALTWNTILSDQAKQELDDLLGSSSSLKLLEPEEVARVLEEEAVPLGFTQEDEASLLAATTLLVDDHAFAVAVQLLSVLCAAHGDDVLVGVRSTLLP